MQRSGFALGLALGLVVGITGTVTLWLVLRDDGRLAALPKGATPSARSAQGGAQPPAQPSPGPPSFSKESSELREKKLLEKELAALRRRAVALSADAGEHPFAAENRVLRQELREVRAALRTEASVRKAQEGAPVPFPRELAPRYQQEEVLRAVTEALKTAALPGEVRSIDCSEYPCIVYGESRVREPGVLDGYLRKSADALRRSYPTEQDAVSTSYWSSSGKDPASGQGVFGVAIYPRPPEGEDDGELRRRLRFRQTQYVDSARGK